ncbi:hypothetical protein P3370_23535, partial [Vibrio parahaemolyticus]|nr:hypothetical protein [Vibrio parahaemolyticus]
LIKSMHRAVISNSTLPVSVSKLKLIITLVEKIPSFSKQAFIVKHSQELVEEVLVYGDRHFRRVFFYSRPERTNQTLALDIHVFASATTVCSPSAMSSVKKNQLIL